MKLLSRIFSRRILFLIQFLIVAFLGYIIFRLGIIPIPYVILFLVILIILLYLIYRGQRNPRKHPIKSTIFKIISLIITICLIFGCIYISKGSSLIDIISGADIQIIEVSVVVNDDSSYEEIDDLKNQSFSCCLATDETSMSKTQGLIEDDIGEFTLNDYSTTVLSANALLDEEVEAMILKEIDRDSLNDTIEEFDDETRVVKTYQLIVSTATANSANVTKEPFVVFIGGTDQSGSISTAGLSDVNIVAVINPNTNQICLVSVPRDYYVDIYGYDGKDKLTHSARSSEGITCTMKTIENLLDIEFNYYVKLNFTSFMNIIDAIGGVDITIPYYETVNGDGTFTTKIYSYYFEPGETHMDAKQALAFVRERKSFVDGDRVRLANQQLMIEAVVDKVCSASIVTKLDDIFETVADSLETNMSSSEIRSLINMQVKNMNSWDIESYSLDGTDSREMEFATIAGGSPNPNGLSVMIPDESTIEQAQEYIEAILNNEVLDID